MVANSLTPSAKLMTLGTRYNRRVVECRFGVALLAWRTGKSSSFAECQFKTFLELQTALGNTLEDMLALVEAHIRPGPYTLEKLEQVTDCDNPFAIVSDVPHVDSVRSQNASFNIYERAKHVFGEAKRVHDFKKTCDDPDLDDETRITKLGALMNESHESCDKLYDCSSKQLNEIIGMSRDAGSLGSRLTGAGWGGCSVSLVRKSEVKTFVNAVMDYYTKERPVGEQLWITDDLDRYIFGTAIGQGAAVLDPRSCPWAM